MHKKYKSGRRRHLSLCFFLECMLSSFLFVHTQLQVFWLVSFFCLRFLSFFQVSMAKVILLSSRLHQLHKWDKCLMLINSHFSQSFFSSKGWRSQTEGGVSVSLNLNSKLTQSVPKMLRKWGGLPVTRLNLVCYLCLTDLAVQNLYGTVDLYKTCVRIQSWLVSEIKAQDSLRMSHFLCGALRSQRLVHKQPERHGETKKEMLNKRKQRLYHDY